MRVSTRPYWRRSASWPPRPDVPGRPPPASRRGVFHGPDGHAASIRVFVPHGYNPGPAASPSSCSLHGAGEAGTDGEKPTHVGLGPAVRAREATFPFLVVFPQAEQPGAGHAWKLASGPAGRRTGPGHPGRGLPRVPGRPEAGVPDRHLGRWHRRLAVGRGPPRPVGGHRPGVRARPGHQGDAVKDVPCWCFHGAADGERPGRALPRDGRCPAATGASPRYTEYPGVGHNSWEAAYDTDELYEWLQCQARK